MSDGQEPFTMPKRPRQQRYPWWHSPLTAISGPPRDWPSSTKKAFQLRSKEGYRPGKVSLGNIEMLPPAESTFMPLTWQQLISISPEWKRVRQFLAQSSDPDKVALALSDEELDMDIFQGLSQSLPYEEFARQMIERENPQRGLSPELAGYEWMSPEKKAFELSQYGRENQRVLNQDVEDRYALGRQAAEGAYNARREEETLKRYQDIQDKYQQGIEKQQKQLIETEKKRRALKGPEHWMRYMVELGETPSWLGYWFSKKGAQNNA